MKKSYKLASVTMLCSMLLLGACHKNEVKSGTNGHSVKTTKTTKSSSSKKTKASQNNKMSTNDNKTTDKEQDNSVTNAQSSEISNSNSQNSASNQQSSTPSIVQSQGGGTQVTSGTLELYQDTPVYASPDKSSEVAYTYPKGNVDWDQYVFENGENWYSFVVSNGTESKRYYIAYSDVKH